jgi:thioredoxin
METKTVLQLSGEEFDKEVLHSAVPSVVDFYADWCGPCRMVSPIIESLSKEYAGKVRFVKIDTDQNQDLAGRYGVMSIPSVMIFKNGQLKKTLVGAMSASAYRKEISSILQQDNS